jgi:hypothetical protein
MIPQQEQEVSQTAYKCSAVTYSGRIPNCFIE